jgi:ribose 5-phosphate isomerase A
MDVDREKLLVAKAAAELVRDGMRVGLGTGSTVEYLVAELARLALSAQYVATSPRTERAARGVGLDVRPFDTWDRLDLAIDGADQIAPDGWLMKGRGGAHTREKIVAASSDRFVVIADSTKEVVRLSGPVPVELSPFGLSATLHRLGPTVVRGARLSPDGGVLADHQCTISDAESLARELSGTPGVVEHGLFEPALVSEVIIGHGETVRRLTKGVNQ